MRMLIAIRGTRHSQTTLQLGTYLLEACCSFEPPTVMTVVEREVDLRDDRAILGHAVERLALSGAEALTYIAEGVPAGEIVRKARSGAYDLVVVGEYSPYGTLGQLSKGSTTWRVVEQVPCSVLIAKGRISPIRRILVCDSGVGDSPALGYMTAQLAEVLDGEQEVTVLHVVPEKGRGAEAEGERPAYDPGTLAIAGHEPRPLVRHGHVVDEVVAEAREGDYDLVIIGAHRQQGWRRLVSENLAFKIAAGLDRPVLVARMPPADNAPADDTPAD
jgi:nucleotide-binding universal stress UspA family protein